MNPPAPAGRPGFGRRRDRKLVAGADVDDRERVLRIDGSEEADRNREALQTSRLGEHHGRIARQSEVDLQSIRHWLPSSGGRELIEWRQA